MSNQDTERNDSPIGANGVLRRQLSDLARVFHGKRSAPDFYWTEDTSHADHGGKSIHINPMTPLRYGVTGPDALRLLAGDVSHEAAHLRHSPRDGPVKFAGRYGFEGDAFAEGVYQTVEDQFIDAKRLANNPGLRATQAFKVATGMQMRPEPADLMDLAPVEAMHEALVQRAYAGQVKGRERLPEEWQAFIDEAGDKFDAARSEDHTRGRMDLAADIAEGARALVTEGDIEMPQPGAGGSDAEGDDDPDGERQPGDGQSTGGDDGEPTDGDGDGGDDADGSDGDGGDDSDDSDGGDGTGSGDGEGEEAGGEGGAGQPDIGDPDDFPDDYFDPMTTGAVGDELAEQMEMLAEQAGLTSQQQGSEPGVGGETPNPDFRWVPDVDPLSQGGAPTFDMEQVLKMYGVDPDEDIYTDPEYEARYARMQTEVKREASELGRKQNERDARRDRFEREGLGEHRLDRVEEVLNETGLVDAVRDAFRQFKTADMYVDARTGDRLNLPNTIDYLSGNTGIEDLFYVQERAEVGDRAIGVTVDMSGSMSGDVLAAKVALVAIAEATDEIGDKFVANTYWSRHSNINTTLITGPDEDFDRRQLNAMTSYGGDPMALGLRELKSLLDGTAAREKVIICITDGQPTVTSGVLTDRARGDSSDAVDESAAYVRDLREEGYLVFGLGLTGVDEDLMETLFDGDWTIVDVNELTDTLIDLYRRQMVVSR